MFASETGCPPPALFVSVSITIETCSPSGPVEEARRARSTSMFPLNGESRLGSSASGTGRSSAIPLADLDVRPRRVEVRVRRDDLAGVDDGAEEDALGAPPLVSRHDERESEHLLHSGAKTLEALRARIGLVADA